MSSSTNNDERIKNTSRFHRFLVRPELGAMGGTLAVFLFFIILAGDTRMFALDGVMNWGIVSAQFIVLAVGVALLMISGEFDLSLGSMLGFSGMMFGLLTINVGLPAWVAIGITFVACGAIGAFNGFLVIKTGLPSFIVTLAAMFILRGLTIWSAITFNKNSTRIHLASRQGYLGKFCSCVISNYRCFKR